MDTSRIVHPLMWCIGVLVLLSASSGLFVAAVYARIHPDLVAGALGQDLVSLLLLPGLLWSARGGERGPALAVNTGLLVYYAYGYSLYVFGPMYCPTYPLFLAILTLSTLALVLQARRIPVDEWHARILDKAPLRATAVLFLITPAVLSPLWIAQLFDGLGSNTPGPFSSVHAMDLAFAFPALVLAAIGLLRREAWGTALAVPLLVKGVAVTASLVIASSIALWRGAPMDTVPVLGIFVTFTFAGAGFLQRFLKALRHGTHRALVA